MYLGYVPAAPWYLLWQTAVLLTSIWVNSERNGLQLVPLIYPWCKVLIKENVILWNSDALTRPVVVLCYSCASNTSTQILFRVSLKGDETLGLILIASR